jgi:uncharacterized small protein (DUF1192 family)
MKPGLPNSRQLSRLQRLSLSIMTVLALVTFLGANLHALLWQSSQWLVSTILPAVVVELTNEERIDTLARPLVRNELLDEAARLKAEHMAKNQYFAHFSPDGVSPWYWFDEAGYVYAHAGENLAIHFTDSAEMVEAWMNSPLHRQNIIDNKFTEIGVGTAKGEYEGYETVFVVQLFGAPAKSAVVNDKVEESVEVESVAERIRSIQAEIERIEENLSATTDEDNDIDLAVDIELESRTEGVAIDQSETKPETVPENVEMRSDDYAIELGEESAIDSKKTESNENSINDVIVVEIPVISTSSGLAVADISTPRPEGLHAGATLSTLATQPNAVLQLIYLVFGTAVIIMLLTSVALAYRRLHYAQVAYGFGLLAIMGGLWVVHGWITGGAVIV